MRNPGVLTAISRTGDLIVKLKGGYNGEKILIDHRGRKIGEVLKVVGPVSSPYVIVRSLVKGSSEVNRFLGREVYLERERNKKPGGKRPARKGSGKHGRRTL
ncbi:MAG: hypothetical protein J7L88_03055 [Thermoplasmata archaeon]|nr:hypothetical protein [Thermoplasmata archaeon]